MGRAQISVGVLCFCRVRLPLGSFEVFCRTISRDATMFPSLEQKLDRYVELEKQLEDPEVLSNIDKMLEIQKEMGGLAKVATAVREFQFRN